MKVILQVCAFAAPYPGNFIKSLKALENSMNTLGYRTIYAFPITAKDKDWCVEFAKGKLVYYLPLHKARITPQTYIIMRKIYRENNVQITHTHFGLYDIPSIMCAPFKTKVYWHLHDAYRPSKKISRNILNRLQYSIFSKRAILISVSDYYRKELIKIGFSPTRTYTVLNGIDLNRIKQQKIKEKTNNLLTFGWDFHTKGVDIIFKALEKMRQNGYYFNLLIVGIPETKKIINDFFNRELPEWLEFYEPVSDINVLFDKADIFIQASRYETFSYAVCEAAYAGLPVIASDIPGLEWARDLPSISFFNSEDHYHLFQVIKLKLDSNEEESNIEKSKHIIKNNFTVEAWARNIIEVYRKELSL